MTAVLDEGGASLLDEGSGIIYDEDSAPASTAPASSSSVPVFLIMNL